MLDCNNHNQVVGNESLDVRDQVQRANLLDRLLVEGANESGHQLSWIGNIDWIGSLQFCRRWKITEFALFGSVLRDDFRPDSDIDVLVTFAPDASWRFYDLVSMKEELEAMFGRPVDLVEKRLVESSENYIRRKHILNHMETIYVA